FRFLLGIRLGCGLLGWLRRDLLDGGLRLRRGLLGCLRRGRSLLGGGLRDRRGVANGRLRLGLGLRGGGDLVALAPLERLVRVEAAVARPGQRSIWAAAAVGEDRVAATARVLLVVAVLG